MDVDQVEAAITPRTKAVVPVHLFGQRVDLDPLMAIAERHGLKVVEDCAQSQGALYRNRRCGSIGTASAFSFYPTKLLGGYGDGGMVMSNDEPLVGLARSLRYYGIEKTYYAERHGYNSRLDEVHAAILALKLPKIDGWIDRRRAIADRYRRSFTGQELLMPKESRHSRHVYHLFVVETAGDRDATLARIEARGLKCGVQYRWPIHLMRGYHDLGYRAGQFPVAERKAERIFSLPIYPHLRDKEVDEVIEIVTAALMAEQEKNIGWLHRRLQASLAVEPKDPAELLAWLEARRRDVPFSAELIPLREVSGWHQDDNGNFNHATGQFFRIEGVRVQSAPGLREITGWDQPILTQADGGVLALLCRETARGVEFLLQARADPGNVGYLQFCPTIQSTWETLRGLKSAKRAPPFAECLDPSDNIPGDGRSTTRKAAGSGGNRTRT